MGRWSRIRQLSATDWRLLGQATILLPLTAAGLRLMGFGRWRDMLARTTAAGSTDVSSAMRERARRIARLMNVVVRRLPYKPTCLHRSIVLWWLLRRQGIASVLELGVRKEDGRFDAHAWVECGGAVLNDSSDVRERFSRFGGKTQFMP